ncbi:FHA domain-containing protein [Hyphomicrobium sp.]|uniref:FHA domain-containing protein n=1 Tax=Hyphomicrobium sp. TaxID=82 RepID=UPI0025C0F0AD|nr:FHA domain-containing protein [Hyphomicrobium sp.]MCC7251579.1 FHA domain-containing protein [Hyphomicrobium sp.]
MSNDPRHPDDDGDAEGDKKTRLIMRPDVNEATSGTPPGGTVIGTTRLVGGLASPAQALHAPPRHAGAQAKTQVVREGTVDIEPVAGWIVIVKGPGRGGFRPVYVGMNSVGRAPSQRIPLDFGDESISREEHAFIAYDDETRTFYLQHGGKSNLVRLGGKPVLQPTELKAGDLFRIGNTTFRFVACCGPDFDWTTEVEDA